MLEEITSLDSKLVGDKYAIEFKFNEHLSSIDIASCTVELIAGKDDDYTALLNGSPQIVGTSVYQRIKSGVSECTYLITCRANLGEYESYALRAKITVV